VLTQAHIHSPESNLRRRSPENYPTFGHPQLSIEVVPRVKLLQKKGSSSPPSGWPGLFMDLLADFV